MNINLDIVPSDLDKALELLDGLSISDKAFLMREGSSSVHHGLGTWLRNNWSLWISETPLVKWFNQKGIRHADDMSAIILEAFVCKLRGETFDLHKKIEEFREFWRRSGVNPDTLC